MTSISPGSSGLEERVTDSRIETVSDHWTGIVAQKVEDFRGRVVGYVNNSDLMITANMVASVVAAIIIGFPSPFVVGSAVLVGICARAFSNPQILRIQKAISDIANHLPFGVKALTISLATIYAPVTLRTVVGLNAGFEIGARVSPQRLAKGIEDAARSVNANGTSK